MLLVVIKFIELLKNFHFSNSFNFWIEWLGYLDSNQKCKNQNLECYHYTISQNGGRCRIRAYEPFSRLLVFKTSAFNHSANRPKMVGGKGFEPLTNRLKVYCSTDWANRLYKVFTEPFNCHKISIKSFLVKLLKILWNLSSN